MRARHMALAFTIALAMWFLMGLFLYHVKAEAGWGKVRVAERATAFCSPQPVAAGGRWAHFGDVAVSRGSWLYRRKIRTERPIRDPGSGRSRRVFRARDKIGSGSALDFYLTGVSEPNCGGFRRRIEFRVWFP